MTEYNPDPKSDAWHRWKGVTPAKRTTHGVTDEEIEGMLIKNKHECQWKQQGNERFCEAGEYRHGYFVSPRLQTQYRK